MNLMLIFMIAWGIPFFIMRTIIHTYVRRKTQEKEMFDKAHELNEKRYELENQKYTAQKLVKCEYCDKHVRFGDGSCPRCGARLKLPD
ncbi:hypothetical protein bpr_II302 (plasmid) [Butyrivibrio proteoclasticus B316]|uniref:Zinc-ribbon domain-containing protein n=1 Tax=Butyrivibrio proteoclasticus (strain ATCC 51982 / DSM 14932 / B316) TaxID=515622 RepID=E0S4A7_BUTPB|nr:hypothetical protein [Butyrivibrio proteoclasticus]ADL36239.1 hypothetical protein bpr_II302 [Butyrivibrio proteoclasticus B316]